MQKNNACLCLAIILSLTFAQFHPAKADANAPPTEHKGQQKPQEKIELDYKTLLPHYADTFTAQLHLILNEYWSEDGNWKADSMNDATAFAPMLLFKIYEKTGCEELYHRAITTCTYERKLISEVMSGKETFDMHSIFGIYGLIPCMKHAKTQQEKDACKNLLQSLIYLMDGALLLDIDQAFFPDWKHNKSIALPMAASLSLEFYEAEKQPAILNMAKKLIEKHENEFYDPNTGLFFGKYYGMWNPALGMLAYARAYSATREDLYLQKANALIEKLKKASPVFVGVLFDSEVLKEEKTWSLYFSTLLIYIDAFWNLYISTGEQKYKDSVKRAIDFAIAEFTLSSAYPDGINDQWFNNQKRIVPFFSHDIHRIEDAKKVSPSYCLGCVFYMLNHIWNYNFDTPKQNPISVSAKPATTGNSQTYLVSCS